MCKTNVKRLQTSKSIKFYQNNKKRIKFQVLPDKEFKTQQR